VRPGYRFDLAELSGDDKYHPEFAYPSSLAEITPTPTSCELVRVPVDSKNGPRVWIVSIASCVVRRMRAAKYRDETPASKPAEADSLTSKSDESRNKKRADEREVRLCPRLCGEKRASVYPRMVTRGRYCHDLMISGAHISDRQIRKPESETIIASATKGSAETIWIG